MLKSERVSSVCATCPFMKSILNMYICHFLSKYTFVGWKLLKKGIIIFGRVSWVVGQFNFSLKIAIRLYIEIIGVDVLF